ncbi:hypothetical protein [Mucilaginibacter sp. UR6-11]|uniref:hypothetical protein n=1 Tax=Mucilaginibacter sp. UR6-11 TaxID=1435644 RepID=UPI001E553722|nr:hypothetical protein [Mucilaginibacter sp. UR6-11]MCC8423628.1 hypothetical protein [Mucilaginibacter sp. UR6-11]
MSKLSDKEIQELLDQKDINYTIEKSNEEGFFVYKTLFEELDNIPQVKLPYSFPNQVINRFEQSKSTESKLRIYTYTAFATIICLAGGGIILNELLGNEAKELYLWLLSYKKIILFVIIVIALIQLFDQKFVKSNRTFTQ